MNDQDQGPNAILDTIIGKLMLKQIPVRNAFTDDVYANKYPSINNDVIYGTKDSELINLASRYMVARAIATNSINGGGKKRTRRGKSRSRKSRNSRKKKRTKKRRT